MNLRKIEALVLMFLVLTLHQFYENIDISLAGATTALTEYCNRTLCQGYVFLL